MEDNKEFIAQFINKAHESIDLLAISGNDFVMMHRYAIAAMADKGIRSRAILADPHSRAEIPNRESWHLHRKEIENSISSLSNWGWEVRTVQMPTTTNCIIIDKQEAFIVGLNAIFAPEPTSFQVARGQAIFHIVEFFERLWSAGLLFEPLYEDLLLSSIPHVADRIVTASSERWHDIIKYFTANPEQMHDLDPWRFEGLVAELLIREGMDVELTQKTKDGGRDILATATTSVGKHLFLVECKHYATDNKVGVSIVRGLYGVVEQERATGGVIVTTSDFTRGAREFAKYVDNRMDLKNYLAIVDWLRKFEK